MDGRSDRERGRLPDRARRYLEHAAGSADPQIDAVHIRMRGEIRLRNRWVPFSATEWLAPHRGLFWRATAKLGALRIRGFDRYLEGRGEMRWRLFGVIPLIHATGADIDRSARGRLFGEAFWVPTALRPDRGVRWSEDGDGWLQARWTVDGVEDGVRLDVGDDGRVRRVVLDRWGDPDRQGWREAAFGGRIESEATFHGITVPSRMSAGWWFGTERWAEGEFFRVVVEDVAPA